MVEHEEITADLKAPPVTYLTFQPPVYCERRVRFYTGCHTQCRVASMARMCGSVRAGQ